MTPRQRSTLILIGAFWLFTFAVLSIRATLTHSLAFNILGPRRLIVAAFGTLLCLLMVALLARLRSHSFSRWILWGVAGGLAMAVALTAFSMTMNRVLAPLPGAAPVTLAESAQWVLIWLGYCLAWTGTHLALTYHWDVQDQQARASAMTALAQEAQIAALRYQINPHFLFNTLNSISSLVLERRNAEAETMLLNLSAFVRTTFTKDPRSMIPLREEIALQQLYLEIEEARFSERLKVLIDVPDDLAGAEVPTLILQPLVENALRHGVGQSEAMTIVRISAVRDGDRLYLAVEDDGAGDTPAPGGSGLGLSNVRDRLRAHFAGGASLAADARPEGGFRAALDLPLEIAA
uniref:sensor histidine kinase n=1 Tax=Sphingomonas bacterium TaxID=1895847 RepID=UPI00261FEFC5|nr:histidine kinase [Sphingomonas bacterium]